MAATSFQTPTPEPSPGMRGQSRDDSLQHAGPDALSGSPLKQHLVTGRLTFHVQPSEDGYHLADGLVIRKDAVATWHCPNCGQAYTGTFGDLLAKMAVVVITTTKEGPNAWHGCIACEDQAPKVAKVPLGTLFVTGKENE